MLSFIYRPTKIICLIFLFCISKSFSQTSDEIFETSKKLYENGKYTDALFSLNKAMKKDSSKSDYYLLRAKIQFKINNYDAAISDCYAALRKEPDKPDVYYLRGQLCQVTKSYGGAILFFGKTLKFSKDEDLTFNSYLNRGHSYFEMGKFNDAYNDYNSALIINQEDVNLLYSLALTNYKLSKINEAKSTIEKIIIIDPEFGLAYELKGQIAKDENNFKTAITNFEEYSKINPTDPKAFSELAETHLCLKEFDKALFNINTSINLQATNPYGYKIKGLIYLEMKQVDEGCNNLFKALQMGYLENVSYDLLELYLKNCESE